MARFVVGGASGLPLADRGRSWDSDAAESRVRSWASSGGEVDFPKYRRAFVVYDADAPNLIGSYKLPFADVVNGKLTAVPRGIFAAAGAIQGARGGVAIPDAAKARARSFLNPYYGRLNLEPPWSANMEILQLIDQGLAEFAPVDGKQGTFRKELIRIGKWIDPRDGFSWFRVTRARLQKIVENFRRNLKRVPFTLRHSKDPLKNLGWVVDLDLEGDKLVSTIEVTHPTAAEKIRRGEIRDVSPGIDEHWIITETGEKPGDVLDHVALTITPHLQNLDPFVECPLVEAEDTSLREKELLVLERRLEVPEETKTEALLERTESVVETLEKAVTEDPVDDKGSETADAETIEMERKKAEEAKAQAEAKTVELEQGKAKIAELEQKLNDEQGRNDNLLQRVLVLEGDKASSEREILTRRVEDAVKTGRLAPALRDKVIEFSHRLHNVESKGLAQFEGREASDVSTLMSFMDIVDNLPKQVQFGQAAAAESKPDGETRVYLTSEDLSKFSLSALRTKGLIDYDESNSKPYWKVGKAPEGEAAQEVLRHE